MSHDAFVYISETGLAAWIFNSAYVWPVLECLHFVSLCVLFGSVLTMDLRLIGVIRGRFAAAAPFLVRMSLIAFAVNLVTGLLFFTGNTFKYVGNPAFELKLVLIFAAGVNALVYRVGFAEIAESDRVTAGSAIVGAISLALWSGVIVCGRMITFYAS